MPIRAALLALAVVASGCAPNVPTAPTPTPFNELAPATLTLSQSGDGLLTAYVQNGRGTPLAGAVVTFAAEGGTPTPTAGPTDAQGRVSSTIARSGDARVTATTGSLTTHAVVLAPVAGSLVPPTTPPIINDPPTSTPSPNVRLNPSGATTGLPTTFGLSANGLNGTTWTWTFGDGTSIATSAVTVTHTYASAGTYQASVSGAGLTSNATVVVTDPPPAPPPPPPPPPPPAPTLIATLSCTPAAVNGGNSSCNVQSLSYGGSPLLASAITSTAWDWGDGQKTAGPSAPAVTHAYAVAGVYTVFATVTATTVDGAKTATATKTITAP